MEILFKNKKDYISHHALFDKKTYENDLKDLSFTFIELKKFPKVHISDLSTNDRKMVLFF